MNDKDTQERYADLQQEGLTMSTKYFCDRCDGMKDTP